MGNKKLSEMWSAFLVSLLLKIKEHLLRTLGRPLSVDEGLKIPQYSS